MSAIERWVRVEGSAWPVSLARVLFALCAWTELGATFRLFSSLDSTKLALSLLFWVASTLMLFGVRARLSTLVTGLTLVASWQLLGEHGGDDHFRRHHTYLLAVLITLLALTPCGGAMSWDRLRGRGADRGDLWALWLIRFQVSAIYLFGAWDKTFPGFPDRMEANYLHLFWGADHPGAWFTRAMFVAAWGAVLLEYALAVAVLSPRWMRWWILPAIAFHAIIYWTLTVSVFSALMFSVFVVLLDPDRVGGILERAMK